MVHFHLLKANFYSLQTKFGARKCFRRCLSFHGGSWLPSICGEGLPTGGVCIQGEGGQTPPELEKWAVGIVHSCNAFLFSLIFVSLIFNVNIN